MTTTQTKKIIIIAGPNGAGKTTFAREYLPNEANCLIFIKAARLMLKEIESNVQAGNSFAFETTLSGKTYAKHIAEWKELGYHITLFFLSLPNEDFAVNRVAARVAAGGHNIPEATIRRRFKAGISNFHYIYKALADSWSLYDNSHPQPILLETEVKND